MVSNGLVNTVRVNLIHRPIIRFTFSGRRITFFAPARLADSWSSQAVEFSSCWEEAISVNVLYPITYIFIIISSNLSKWCPHFNRYVHDFSPLNSVVFFRFLPVLFSVFWKKKTTLYLIMEVNVSHSTVYAKITTGRKLYKTTFKYAAYGWRDSPTSRHKISPKGLKCS